MVNLVSEKQSMHEVVTENVKSSLFLLFLDQIT